MSTESAPQLGPIIQAERKARHLTLEQLAARSGVSKSMLSQIERGEANPTFAVLWGLTQALQLDLSELVGGGISQKQAETIEVVSLAHTPEIRSPKGDWTLRILSPPNLASQVEWYEVEIAPGKSLASSPHSAGTTEHLTAWTDGLTVISGGSSQKLAKGETARYRADLPHEIVNDSTAPARALMVVHYRS
ncbi:helix-turn-helix domain-containing protein [Devosia sp.]|uniref:helix-turn-helix domain-containing protein n=1 Tax=Devosia sp. TaxID=1871048 RepID=UPI001B23B41C|nr:XRE family transcriptional regulator [Devosia sp.]MBO9587585.1 helix-turn-helix transcriptional regulator [Devosia sp.]